ncbi:MAG: trigger factor, partial [Streptosporangiales bacterium]|nr:trigger factor [Streptosporangiales bacterium]
MKTDVEELSPTRVKLSIEVPFEELEANVKQAYKEIAQQVRLKGFRPGKAPARLIDQYVGRGAVLSEAVNHAVPELYGKAVQEAEVFALGQPQVEITEIEDGKQLSFTAEVDVRPRFEVPEYDALPVTVDSAEITPDDVEEQIGNLRERFATLSGVERPVENGDYVSIDLSATIAGEELEDLSSTGTSYEVGSGSMLEGLDDALPGMSAEESKTFTTTLVGGDPEGEQAEVTVTVQSVKAKELPELDDEFAQMASEFDTIGELRESIREQLTRSKRYAQVGQARDRALEALLERVDIPLPDSVVSGEVDRRKQSLDQQLESAGLSREAYLQMQDQSEEDFDSELDEGSRKAVKAGFILDQLALQEELGVDDSDLTGYVVDQAMRMGVSPDALAQHLVESNQISVAYTEVLRGKALSLVVEHAKVTDEDGNEVDVMAVQREAEGGEEEADESAEVTAETTDAETTDA